MKSDTRLFNAASLFVRGITRVFLVVCGVLIILALAGLAAEIVLRYVFDSPLSKVHEATTIAFVFVFLLGAAALYARNEDIVIEFFYQRLPPLPGKLLVLVVYLGTAVAMLIVLGETIALMDRQMHIPTPSLRLPMSIYGLALAIASATIALSSLVEAWSCVTWLRTGRRPSVWPEETWDDSLADGS